MDLLSLFSATEKLVDNFTLDANKVNLKKGQVKWYSNLLNYLANQTKASAEIDVTK